MYDTAKPLLLKEACPKGLVWKGFARNLAQGLAALRTAAEARADLPRLPADDAGARS